MYSAVSVVVTRCLFLLSCDTAKAKAAPALFVLSALHLFCMVFSCEVRRSQKKKKKKETFAVVV